MSVVSQGLRPAGFQKESFAGKTAHQLTPERIKLLTDFVEQSRQELEVPGVGFALIDDGKMLWEGGFGVRALGFARKGRRAYQVHDRVEHQGDDHAAALDARRRGQAALGREGRRPLP